MGIENENVVVSLSRSRRGAAGLGLFTIASRKTSARIGAGVSIVYLETGYDGVELRTKVLAFLGVRFEPVANLGQNHKSPNIPSTNQKVSHRLHFGIREVPRQSVQTDRDLPL